MKIRNAILFLIGLYFYSSIIFLAETRYNFHETIAVRETLEHCHGFTGIPSYINVKADSTIRNNEGESALMIALKHCSDNDVLENFLKAGSDVNEPDNFGNTPLMYAAQYSDDTAVKMLIEAGALINVRNNDGWTPLMIAARYNTSAVECLLKENPDLEVRDRYGYTALHISICWNKSAVGALLNAGAHIQAKAQGEDDNYEKDALEMAIPIWLPHEEDYVIIKQLLQAWTKINANNEGVANALRAAIEYCPDLELIESLIKAGADVNGRGPYGKTVLMLENAVCTDVLMRRLVKAGADINSKDYYDEETPLFTALQFKSPCLDTLLELGADVNAQKGDGSTPLMELAYRISWDQGDWVISAFQKLLNAGADCTIKDNDGQTVLSILQKGNQAQIKFLTLLNDYNVQKNLIR